MQSIKNKERNEQGREEIKKDPREDNNCLVDIKGYEKTRYLFE